MPPEAPQPPLRLVLDTGALIANWRALDRLSGSARAGAAVKADGYSTGARRVVTALAGVGCRDFFVAYSSEAAELTALVDPGQISVLHGPLSASDVHFMQQSGLRPVINSLPQARLWLEAGGGTCDLMIDTGINRLGLSMASLGDPLVAKLDVQVLMSHMASADEDCAQNEVQRLRWEEARRQINTPEASLANSAAIMLGSAYHGDLTRPGLSLYGGIPRAEMAEHIAPVIQPQVAILQVRDLVAGESVGYNATFTASHAMRVGVVALGYADGYLRAWSGKGLMHHGEAAFPVIGRVSMDMTVIDLSAAPQLREGDWLDLAYSLPESAEVTGLSQYELLTLLGRRFAR